MQSLTSSFFSKDSSLSFLLAKAALVYRCCVGKNKTCRRHEQSSLTNGTSLIEINIQLRIFQLNGHTWGLPFKT